MSADQIAETIDRDVDRAARADLSVDGDTNESVTEFYAEILAVKHEALTLRQRAIEVSTMNSFAARSELGQMESELAALHDDVRSAYRALLTQEYAQFDRVSEEFEIESDPAIERHHGEIREELDAVSAEVIQTRSAISDQKVTQMLTSGLLIALVILLLTIGILLATLL